MDTLKTKEFTTTPIEADHNWVRPPKPGHRYFGLSRSHLYALDKAGLIRSISLRQAHHRRGVRLLFVPSIREYLDRLDREQNGAKK
jgi:hypothetical protein